MKEIKLKNGNIYMTFYVFSNGNALFVEGNEIHTIEDFASKYIMLRESGFEDC